MRRMCETLRIFPKILTQPAWNTYLSNTSLIKVTLSGRNNSNNNNNNIQGGAKVIPHTVFNILFLLSNNFRHYVCADININLCNRKLSFELYLQLLPQFIEQ